MYSKKRKNIIKNKYSKKLKRIKKKPKNNIIKKKNIKLSLCGSELRWQIKGIYYYYHYFYCYHL